jgi:hypothetical protein
MPGFALSGDAEVSVPGLKYYGIQISQLSSVTLFKIGRVWISEFRA